MADKTHPPADVVSASPEKCPKCGANSCGSYQMPPGMDFTKFMCQSRQLHGSYFEQSGYCRERELEQPPATPPSQLQHVEQLPHQGLIDYCDCGRVFHGSPICPECGRPASSLQPPAKPPETSGEKCPKCGAEFKPSHFDGDIGWTCGTKLWRRTGNENWPQNEDHIGQSDPCRIHELEQQLADVTEERGRWARKCADAHFEVNGLQADLTAATSRAEKAEADNAVIVEAIRLKNFSSWSKDHPEVRIVPHAWVERLEELAAQPHPGDDLLERVKKLERLHLAAKAASAAVSAWNEAPVDRLGDGRFDTACDAADAEVAAALAALAES